MLVAIPSKGRAGRARTAGFMRELATLFVPENEAPAYRALYGDVVAAVPQAVVGITATRNWILDVASQRGEQRVVFVDDDVEVVGWFEMLGEHAKQRRIGPEVCVAEFEKLFDVAAGLGYRLWGVSSDGALRSTYPWRPFIFRTYVTASCMGLVNDERRTRFDETFRVKEDYELCLRCLVEDGGVVGARYMYWRNSHWTDEGGCADYRTRDMERSAIRALMEKYPGLVRHEPNKQSFYSIRLEV